MIIIFRVIKLIMTNSGTFSCVMTIWTSAAYKSAVDNHLSCDIFTHNVIAYRTTTESLADLFIFFLRSDDRAS